MADGNESIILRSGDVRPGGEMSRDRRTALKKLGRFAAITAPCVTLMLAAGTKPAGAQSCSPCESSRAFKAAGGGIDRVALLAGLQGMPVEIGAIQAVDFRAAFGIGDGRKIHPLDAIGVCLGAIQALSRRVDSLQAAPA